LDIFLIPLRTRLAETEFAQTKLRVSNEILDLAFDVRQTYYKLLAENQKMGCIRSLTEITRIHSDIVAKQISVGNVNTLDARLAQSKLLEAELELAQSQTEIILLKEKLNRLLGLSEDVCLKLPDVFIEETDYRGFDLCSLETLALENRL